MREEQKEIQKIKERFKSIINVLMKCKKDISGESMKVEESMERLRKIMSAEQTAKFLILMERFQANKQFSVHNLWNIKSINKEDYVKKSLEFNRKLQE